MNNIKNSRKSTQKVCRELKENKNSGLQDNTHFQTIGSSWKVKFVNSVILGDFEGGETFDQQLISSWNIPTQGL